MVFALEEKNPSAVALLAEDGTAVTYGELCRESEFMETKWKRRDLIFCLCENSPGAVVGYIAALHNRVVPLMLDAGLGIEQLLRFYHTYHPNYIWAPESLSGQIKKLGCGRAVYTAYGYGLWETVFGGRTKLHDRLGLLLATSGSTGNPKLVRLSLENVESNAEAIRSYLRLNDRERPITTLPMQYTYGLSIINSHLLAGACILMTKSSYVQNNFWEFLEREGATSFGGVPYTYQILKKMRVFRRKIPSLTSLTQAGGKLSPELQKEIALWAGSQGISFYIMYGQTEATARMGYLPPEKCLEKPGSMGIAIPGGEFSLIDESGNEICEADTVGELVYKGPNVSLGYAETREDLSLGDEREGVLYTGDMAKRDEDGFFYIAGRKKRFIKIFGVRVSLDSCEQILREHFPEADIACAGDDDHLEIYVTDESAAKDAADILSDFLKLSRSGFRSIFIDEIPRSDSGKVLYEKLREVIMK